MNRVSKRVGLGGRNANFKVKTFFDWKKSRIDDYISSRGGLKKDGVEKTANSTARGWIYI